MFFMKYLCKSRRAFTLIELMIVVVIIGILATLGIANYISMKENAKFASCVSNQKNIHECSLLYILDNQPGTAALNVQVLTFAMLITQKVGECPSSANIDFDDYTINVVNNEVTGITCDIKGADHLYTP